MRVLYENEIEGQIEPVDQVIKNVEHIEFAWSVNDGSMLKVFTEDNDEPIWVILDNVYCIDNR